MPTEILARPVQRRWKPGAWNATKRLYAIVMAVVAAMLLGHAERVMRQVWNNQARGPSKDGGRN